MQPKVGKLKMQAVWTLEYCIYSIQQACLRRNRLKIASELQKFTALMKSG